MQTSIATIIKASVLLARKGINHIIVDGEIIVSAKTAYTLSIEYPAKFYAQKFDARLEKLLKRSSSSSGMGMGSRDIQFEFSSLSEAKNAERSVIKLKALHKDLQKGLKTNVEEE